jgi:hypothetical protein
VLNPIRQNFTVPMMGTGNPGGNSQNEILSFDRRPSAVVDRNQEDLSMKKGGYIMVPSNNPVDPTQPKNHNSKHAKTGFASSEPKEIPQKASHVSTSDIHTPLNPNPPKKSYYNHNEYSGSRFSNLNGSAGLRSTINRYNSKKNLTGTTNYSDLVNRKPEQPSQSSRGLATQSRLRNFPDRGIS